MKILQLNSPISTAITHELYEDWSQRNVILFNNQLYAKEVSGIPDFDVFIVDSSELPASGKAQMQDNCVR